MTVNDANDIPNARLVATDTGAMQSWEYGRPYLLEFRLTAATVSATVTDPGTGATLMVDDGKPTRAGLVLAMWDPHTRPIITEYAGTVKFENVEEGVTVAKQIDEVTGLSTLVVIDPKRRGSAKIVRPQVKLIDASGNEVKIPGTDHSVTIGFPIGALIQVRDGQDLSTGEVLARIPTLEQDGLRGGVQYHDGQFDDARQLRLRHLRVGAHRGAAQHDHGRHQLGAAFVGIGRGAVQP